MTGEPGHDDASNRLERVMTDGQPLDRPIERRLAELEARLIQAEGDVVFSLHVIAPLVELLVARGGIDRNALFELIDQVTLTLERVRAPTGEAARAAYDLARERLEALQDTLRDHAP